MTTGLRRSGHCAARRLLSLLLACLVLAACTESPPDGGQTPEPSSPAAAIERDYWPTAGWRTASASDHGVDPTQLAMLEDHIATAYPHLRSLVVVRHGYLVYEHYRKGLDETSGHDVRSVTKSVVGALVGCALAEGRITSLDQPVEELLRPHVSAGGDPRFADVTVKHLLTMTAGLPGDDPNQGGDPRVSEAMWASPDWIHHILSQQLVSEPGTQFAYNDPDAHLLSAIVADVSGQSTLDYARTRLFGPLGIRAEDSYEPTLGPQLDDATIDAYERSSSAWPVDPQGYNFGAAFLRLPARDLAKFGYLYLNGGSWDGRQLIPADYVAAATSATGSPTNVSAGYGWLWWVGTEGGRTFMARGRGGQLIYVAPELDLVVVATSDPEAGGLDPKILVSQSIVPAVTP